MMKHHDLPVSRRLWAGAGTAALVVGGLMLTAAGAPPAPVATVAPPAPPAPPAAPAAPARQVRTLIIKDGQVIENSTGAAPVVVTTAPAADGKAHRIVMIRHDDSTGNAALDAIINDATTDATNKVMKKVIVTCTKGSAKDCGTVDLAAINPTIRESLAAARKSIEASPGLSAEQRQAALAGLDEALRDMADEAKPPAK